MLSFVPGYKQLEYCFLLKNKNIETSNHTPAEFKNRDVGKTRYQLQDNR